MCQNRFFLKTEPSLIFVEKVQIQYYFYNIIVGNIFVGK